MNPLFGRLFVLIGICFVSGIGCGQAPDEPASTSSGRARLAASDSVVGYRHSFAASRFHLGTSAKSASDGTLSRMVGSHGAAAIEPNGSFRAISNGDSPSLLRPRLSGNGAAHDQRVFAYFTGAGLPSDQVGRINTFTHLEGGGPANVAPGAVDDSRLVGYISQLERAVDGVPVVGSFAWARFNVDDDVVAEHVYWPPISRGTLQDAQALKAHLQAHGQVAFLEASGFKGETGVNGRLVIVHTSATWTGPFVARASFDFEPVGSRSTIHLGFGGSFRLPHEELSPGQNELSPGQRDQKP